MDPKVGFFGQSQLNWIVLSSNHNEELSMLLFSHHDVVVAKLLISWQPIIYNI